MSQITNGTPLNLPQEPANYAPTGNTAVSASMAATQATSAQNNANNAASQPSSTPNIDSSSTTGNNGLPPGVTSVSYDANGNPIDQNGNPIDYTQSPTYTTAENQVNQSQSELQADINNAPSEATLLQNSQNQYGVTGDMQTVQNLTTQLASQNAAYNTASANAETQGIQSGTPGVFYQGEQAAIQRQQAVVTASTAAQLQAAQGNYTMAENLATQAADLAYTDAQNQITNMQKLVQLNQTNLSTAEKTAVAQIAAAAKTQQAAVTAGKTNMKNALTAGVTTPFFKYANSDTVYNAQGQPLSYQQYIQQGGDPSFKDVSTVGKTATTKTGLKVTNGPTAGSNTPTTPSFKLGSTQDIAQATNNTDTMLQEGNPSAGYPGIGTDGYANPATYNYLYSQWEALVEILLNSNQLLKNM